ncbi:MAG: hypothetical protein AAF591_15820 [Verrucomicrobiota bacterium]
MSSSPSVPEDDLPQAERRARRERRIHSKRARRRTIIVLTVSIATILFVVWALFLRNRSVGNLPPERPVPPGQFR